MICNFPDPIIANIKSYFEIWERFGISKHFVSTIQDQLEWPRDINGLSNSSISYYSNVRLPKNCNIYPVFDLHLHYQCVKNCFTFNFVVKEATAIISIYHKCINIQPILDVVWSTHPFPKAINVFKNYIHLTFIKKNYVGYHNESDTIGEAQLLNHWLELVKKITVIK